MFHVLAFNPHPLLRHCVDSYLVVSVISLKTDMWKTVSCPILPKVWFFPLLPGSGYTIVIMAELCSPSFYHGAE